MVWEPGLVLVLGDAGGLSQFLLANLVVSPQTCQIIRSIDFDYGEVSIPSLTLFNWGVRNTASVPPAGASVPAGLVVGGGNGR